MTLYLGLDPGLRRTGWAVVSRNASSFVCEAGGVITPSTRLPLEQRLWHIGRTLRTHLDQHSITHAAVERPFSQKFPASALLLGCVRGVLLMTLAEYSVPVTEYAPNHIKKWTTGYGHSTKATLQQWVALGVRFATSFDVQGSSDASDALAVAMVHAHGTKIV